MNKKLMAVAVAGALAAPGLAMAQSTVTISGFIKADVGQINIGNANAVRAGLNTSTMAFEDGGPSRVRFTMREDLGGGLYGLGQLEIRPTINGRSTNGVVNMGFGSTAGNQWVGLESTSLGTIRLGAVDQYYLEGGGYAGIYGPIDTTLPFLTYVNANAPGSVQVATGFATRSRNVIHYDSPSFSGLTFQLGYSVGNGASGGSADLATGARKTSVWYTSLRYNGGPFNLGWNHLSDKGSLGGAAPAAVPTPIAAIGIQSGVTMASAPGALGEAKLDTMADRLFGEWNIGGGFTAQLGWDRTRLSAASGVAVTAAGVAGSTNIATRTSWILSGKFETGPHFAWATYGRAANAGGDLGTVNGAEGATGWNIGYAYLFSKRTSIGVGYGRISNNSGGYYSLANEYAATSDTTGSGYNVNSSMSRPGEKPSYLGMSMRHVF